MKYILQIFTGSGDASAYPAEEIIDKIRSIAFGADVGKVIIGWSRDASVYAKIGSFLHASGIQMLLWLPVFSEISECLGPDQAVDVFGEAVGMPDPQDGEAFHFVCPSSPRNAQIVKDTYEKHFAGCGFDGVFLDRIRGQSFAAGVSGVLSCACGRCRKAFLDRGVNTDEVRELYGMKGDSFYDIASWPANGEFVLENPLAQRFFAAREEIVAEGVAEITEYFKSKGLTVGLDLFAPFVSRIAGQNYSLITKHADFIKPMLYRRTDAPAGIGYEYALFEQYAPNARGKTKLSQDIAFLHTQLQAIKKIPCEKYPGIEINYDENLVKTDPEYIRESLAAVRDHGLDGAALCWNVMRAPEAHIGAVTVQLLSRPESAAR